MHLLSLIKGFNLWNDLRRIHRIFVKSIEISFVTWSFLIFLSAIVLDLPKVPGLMFFLPLTNIYFFKRDPLIDFLAVNWLEGLVLADWYRSLLISQRFLFNLGKTWTTEDAFEITQKTWWRSSTKGKAANNWKYSWIWCYRDRKWWRRSSLVNVFCIQVLIRVL